MGEAKARMKLTAVPSEEGYASRSELGDAAHVGGGEGEVSGAINGTVKWELFESQGNLVCSANMTGTIFAEVNSALEFSALGFFGRNEGSDKWRLTSGRRVSLVAAHGGLTRPSGRCVATAAESPETNKSNPLQTKIDPISGHSSRKGYTTADR